jgi:hypothetical protein
MDWIRLITITIQQCILMSRVIIPSACITAQRLLSFQGGFPSMELAAVVTFWQECQASALVCTLGCEMNLTFYLRHTYADRHRSYET